VREADFEPLVLDEDSARVLTDQIRDDVKSLLPKIKLAYAGRADRALGYSSWEEYCKSELSSLRLPLPERRELVAQLRESNMSTREIASALNVGLGTVSRDLQESTTVPSGTVASEVREEKVRELRADGAPYADIAKELQMSITQISTAERSNGVDPDIQELAKRNEEILAAKREGVPMADLTKRFGLSKSAINKIVARNRPNLAGGSRATVGKRRDAFQVLADQGYSAEQIADALGYADVACTRVAAKKFGITIHADAVQSRLKKRHDSSRILQETYVSLGALFEGVDLVDFEEIKPDEAAEMLPEFQAAYRSLSQLIKSLKGIAE
jgi:transposase